MGWIEANGPALDIADVVVIVEDGLVQKVFTRDKKARVFVLDLDNQGADLTEMRKAEDELTFDKRFTQTW